MVSDEIYAWLDNTGSISDDLQAHLDHNLETFGSMFYPPVSYNLNKYPPSELNYQITKGFISYFTNMLTDIMSRVDSPDITSISIQQFNNEYSASITKLCKNKKFTPRTLMCMYIPTDFCMSILPRTTNEHPVYTELMTITNTLSPVTYRYVRGIINAVVNDTARNINNKPQLDKIKARLYVKSPDIDEETKFLELLEAFENKSTTLKMINTYKQKNLPDLFITPINELDVVKNLHRAFKEAMCSDTAHYILESENIKTRLAQLGASDILIPAEIQPLLKTARLLADNLTEQKNILRSNGLSSQQNHTTDDTLDIIF